MSRLLAGRPDDVAVVDAGTGEQVDYRRLTDLVDRRCRDLAQHAGHVVLLAPALSVDSVVTLLALVQLGATTLLVDPLTPQARLASWVTAYRPQLVIGISGPAAASTDAPGPPRADRILLATSGSTGSPRFVRLSEHNVLSNARQIATALRIDRTDRAITTLPFHYSYGLSVLTSHLGAGASVLVSSVPATRPEFRALINRHQVTSLAGVPFTYEVYERTGLFEADLPSLRSATAAGGRLPDERIRSVGERLAAKGAGLWTMYGQTEATARISILPPEELPEQCGSVGYSLPGETIAIVGPDERGVGEIHVHGPNVMQGYAHARADLDSGDHHCSQLATGDLGRLDAAGRLWITGRTKRIAKPFGVRVSLDDVESALAPAGVVAITAIEDRIVAVTESTVAGPRELERAAGLPTGCLEVITVPSVPRTHIGKVDLPALTELVVSLRTTRLDRQPD